MLEKLVMGWLALTSIAAVGCTTVAAPPATSPPAAVAPVGAQCRVDGPAPCSICAVTCAPGQTARCIPGEVLYRGPAFSPLCVRDSACGCQNPQ